MTPEETLQEVVRDAIRRGDYARAEQAGEQALERFIAEGNLPGQATALYQMGLAYRFRGDKSLALDALQQCLALRESLGDSLGVANTLNTMGTTFLQKADLPAALDALQRSLTLSRAISDRQAEANALFNIASAYKHLGDPATALESLHASLSAFEAMGDQGNTVKALFNIANTYNVLENPEEAIRYAERGMPFLENSENYNDLAIGLNMLGTAYVKQKRLDLALDHFQRSEQLFAKVGGIVFQAVTLADIGDVLLQMGRLDEARGYLERSLELIGTQDHRLAYCEALGRLGSLYARQDFADHSDDTALRLLEEARQVGEALDVPTQLCPIYTELTTLYERRGELTEALANLRRLRESEKRLFNEASDQRVRNLEVRYQVEKTRQEAEIARRDAEIARLRTVELAEALEEAERMRALADERARTDSLTGVYNRRYLDEQVADEFERACRYRRPLTIALVDLDHFKRINDLYGHRVGDIVLRRAARLMVETCRSGDRIARYGGEEFALLLPETSAAEAQALCERVRERIAAEDWSRAIPDLYDNASVTVSIGVSSLGSGGVNIGKFDDVSLLLEAADQSLYLAKAAGRNRVVNQADITTARAVPAPRGRKAKSTG